jgi:hypothetical protein
MRVPAVMLVVLVQAGATGRSAAQGGPPLETDDPGTPGVGHVELNISVEAEREAGRTVYDAPHIDANVGVGARFQLKVEVPWRIGTARAEPARTGIGNVVVGVKWRFAEPGNLAVSTYPQVTFGSSERARADDLAEPGSVFLPVEIAWHRGPLSLGAEVGYEVGQGDSELVFGLALARTVGRFIELLGECHGAGTEFSELGMLCGTGLRWELGQAVSALAAVAVGVAGSQATRPDRRWYTGAQLRW